MFVKINNKLVNTRHIREIDCSQLESKVRITIRYFNDSRSDYESKFDCMDGQPAIDLLMQLNPSILEGKRLKFIRNDWALHNLVAHPLLQVLAWLKLTKLGIKIHDKTVPRPRANS